MNELAKLFTSLLLVGAGFFAASFVGPPEVVDRLARYLQPTGELDPNGLQPLPAPQAGMASQQAWPDLPAPPAQVAQQAEPSPPAFGGNLAPVAARLTSDSQAVETPSVEPSGWPTLPTQARQANPVAAPASDDWLTGESVRSKVAAPPRVEPIPRRVGGAGAMASEPSLPPQPEAQSEPFSWPTLQAPTSTPAPIGTAEAPALPTSLENSPYGGRPQFDAFADATETLGNPLRYETRREPVEAIGRQPLATKFGEHIVTDGDTLALLAERYLGDAGRARELFELNSDRLEHPDVLPIGMVLHTPDEPRRGQSRVATDDGFPALDPSQSGFAQLAASGAGHTLTRDPFPVERRPLTSAGSSADARRPVDPASAPLYDREVMWDPGQW